MKRLTEPFKFLGTNKCAFTIAVQPLALLNIVVYSTKCITEKKKIVDWIKTKMTG